MRHGRLSVEGAHDWGDGYASIRFGKKADGRELDGRTWDEFPDDEI